MNLLCLLFGHGWQTDPGRGRVCFYCHARTGDREWYCSCGARNSGRRCHRCRRRRNWR